MNKIQKTLFLLVTFKLVKDIVKPKQTQLPLSGKDMIKDFDKIFKTPKTDE